MPRGIPAIRKHVIEVDDVPLRVPVFTDCSPDAVSEMIQVMQEGGDVVACLGMTRYFVCVGFSRQQSNNDSFLLAEEGRICKRLQSPMYPLASKTPLAIYRRRLVVRLLSLDGQKMD